MRRIVLLCLKIVQAFRVAGKYIFMYLMMLMPRDRKLCVFGAWLGERFTDNSMQLFLEAERFPELRTVWISREQAVVDEVRRLGREAYLWNSRQAIWCQMRAKYGVVSNGISDLQHTYMGGAILVDLWHGVPLKKLVYDNKYEKDWDSPKQRLRDFLIKRPLGKEYYVATSETFVPIYESAFRKPRKQIICLGQPRCDVFFKREKPEPYFAGKKIILYCPTHRMEGAEKMELGKLFDLAELERFLAQENYWFVVKKHFYHRGESEDLSSYPHILDVTGEEMDVQRLEMETEILITDYSSVYIDYLLLDKPVLFYCYDYERYLQQDREMYFDYEEVTPGAKARNFEELLAMLREVMQSGADYDREERERVKNLFFCREGQGAVSDILLDKIINGDF